MTPRATKIDPVTMPQQLWRTPPGVPRRHSCRRPGITWLTSRTKTKGCRFPTRPPSGVQQSREAKPTLNPLATGYWLLATGYFLTCAPS